MSPRNNVKPGAIIETFGGDKFADALRAMAEVTSKPNVAKNHTVDIEGAIDTVFMAVDALASLHPAISAIKVPLIIIKNCAINRENRSRIALMKLKMAEMLCALFEIRFIQVDEETAVDIGSGQVERFAGALTLLCKEISNTLVKVGNLVERYAKEGSLRRVIWANDWKQQIKDCCEECDRNKQSIGYRIKVFTARQVHDISKTLSEIKVSTDVISKQFDPTQQKERQLYDEIKKRGLEGRLDRLTDDELIELANKADESGGSRPNTQELRAYRMSVKELLDSSLRGFEIRLDMHTKQLDRALYHLKRLPTDARLYQRIEDPDIRKLWREWKWAGSVEAGTFTLNLYDYFIDLTREARREAALSQSPLRPGSLTVQTSLVLQQSLMSPLSDVGGDDFGDDQCTMGSDALGDYWCTRYFSFRNMSIFMEAMDADGNGLIKIKEVNEFTRAKPPSLSLMEWIAYRSYGWLIASYLYKLRIEYMIELMLAIDYAPQNCSAVAGYFIRVPNILNLLSTIQTPVLEDSSLMKVVHTVMSHQEKQLEDVLDTLKYNVTEDGITLLSSVNGAEGFEMGSELESFLLPALFLLLFRHYELIKLSAKYVLNEDEIGRNANMSIGVILSAVEDRVRSLADHFRKMQLDVRQKFESFANGMYKGVYRVQTSDMSFTQIQDEATVPQNTLHWLSYLLRSYDCQENKLHTQLNTSANVLRPELTHYGRLPIFETLASETDIVAPADDDCLRFDNYVSLVHLRERYGAEFVRSWNPEVDAERPRASLTHTDVPHELVGCDGCGSAVMGIRYKCVQCENYDYCETCQANPPPIPQDNPVLALHNGTHDFLAFNQDAPNAIVDMMRSGLESHERAVVVAFLTHDISEAKQNAAHLAAFIQFCSDPSLEDRTEAVQRAESFLDSLGEAGQTVKESLSYLKLWRNTQGHYASCDGCRSYIQGNRFECVDCFDFDFCQECYDTRGSGVGSIGQHESTHRFAIVRYPVPWLLIRRLLACAAEKDTRGQDMLRQWRQTLQFFRSTKSTSDASESQYEEVEEEDDGPMPNNEDCGEELDDSPGDGTAQEETDALSEEPAQSGDRELAQSEGSQPGDESVRQDEDQENDHDGYNGFLSAEDKQDVPSAEAEASHGLQDDTTAEPSTMCDGLCERPIAGDMYRCLLCEDCLLCSDCALSDTVIRKVDPPHRPTHVMQIIPVTPSADEGTSTDDVPVADQPAHASHPACTSADVARLEARMNSMEEKLNDTSAQMSALLTGIKELLVRLGSAPSS